MTANQKCEDENEDDVSNEPIRRQSTNVLTTDARQFKQYDTIIKISAHNNLYFRYFPRSFSNYWYYNIILSKKYPFCCITIVSICTLLNWVSNKTHNTFLQQFFETIAWIVTAWATLSYLLSLNIDIIKLTLKTFDFWFKMLNASFVGVSQFLLFTEQGTPISTIVLSLFAELFIVLDLFLCDAAFLHEKMKICLLLCAVCGLFGWSLWTYFEPIDIFWDPFSTTNENQSPSQSQNNSATNISMKNVFISGLNNIGFFTLKSMIRLIANNGKILDCKHKVQAKIKHKEPKQRLTQNNLFKSSTVVNRPYFQWTDVQCEREERDEKQLDNILASVVNE